MSSHSSRNRNQLITRSHCTSITCVLVSSLGLHCGLSDALFEKSFSPAVRIIASPESFTASSEAKFALDCNKRQCDYFCSLSAGEDEIQSDEKTFTACSNELQYPGLTEGTYEFLVYATDASKLKSPTVSYRWVIDQTAPQTEIDPTFNGFVNTATQGLSFSCLDKSPCTYRCFVDGVEQANCGSPLRFPGFENGDSLQLVIEATDAAGNIQEELMSPTAVTIDNDPPIVRITSYPGINSTGRDNRTEVSLSFETEEINPLDPHRFECQLNNNSIIEDCESPWEPTLTASTAETPAIDTPQTARIRATDSAGNIGEWSQITWIRDQTAPRAFFLDTPDSVSAERDPTFKLGCSENSCRYLCKLDSGNQTACGQTSSQTTHTIMAIPVGEHSLEIVAVDDAGNRSAPIQYTWRVVPKWKEFATSGYHSCAITHTGTLLCWGVNEYGQAGNTLYPNQEEPGRYEPTLVPTQVTEERNWTSVSVSMTHTCATKSDGTLWCWGLNKLNSDTYSRLALNSVIEHYSEPQLLNGQGWLKVAAGKDHSCAARSDNTLWCWGSEFPFQRANLSIDPSDQQGNILQIAIGNQSCALVEILDDQNSLRAELFCSESSVVTLSPQGTMSPRGWRSFSLGKEHECAVSRESQIFCRGSNTYKQTAETGTFTSAWTLVGAPDATWKSVAAAEFSTCGVSTSGDIHCWGAEHLGHDGTASRAVFPPEQVPFSEPMSEVMSHGESRSICAFGEKGSLFCWGDNRFGQLGLDRGDKSKPYLVSGPTSGGWLEVELGRNHTCGRRSDNNIYCWGANESLISLVATNRIQARFTNGQLGAQIAFTSNSQTAKLRFLERPRSIVTTGIRQGTEPNEDWSSALNWSELDIYHSGNASFGQQTDNDTYAWGESRNGHLGLGDNFTLECLENPRTVISGPVEVRAPETLTQVSLGKSHACGRGEIDPNNNGTRLYCWGDNASGQLGIQANPRCLNYGESSSLVVSPTNETNPQSWLGVASGSEFTCGRDISDNVFCWGDNSSGQLGQGDTLNRTTPSIVGTDTYFEISTGYKHVCAITLLGELSCWGNNQHGQLGTQVNSDSSNPVTVISPSTDPNSQWFQVDSGSWHTCAILDESPENTLWCWGLNDFGQLGHGELFDTNVPTAIDATQTWRSVSAGYDHTCAISSNNELFCWGSNAYGKLGHGQVELWPNTPQELK
ncbi:MAG: hypothetical protein VYC39_16850 [Myxococcota bacterium]|nr:hypothetical protein [Myxococcota bacterium]